MKFCMSMRLKKAHHLKNFSLMHLRSLLIYILLGKNKEGGAGLFIIFPSACCARERERVWNFCFLLSSSVSFYSVSFLLQKSCPCTPVAVLSTFLGKHTINFEEENNSFWKTVHNAGCSIKIIP